MLRRVTSPQLAEASGIIGAKTAEALAGGRRTRDVATENLTSSPPAVSGSRD